MRSLRLRTGSALLVVATVALAGASGAQAAPTAQAAATCDISKVATTLGPTSVTALSVTKTTCKNGIAVVKAFHACRLKNGVSGRCVKKVKGYACREVRTNGPSQFTATVTCSKGKARVKHAYTQSLG